MKFMKEDQKRQNIVRGVRRFGHFLDHLVIIAVILLLLLGLYALWDSRQVYADASARQYEVYRPGDRDGLGFEQLREGNRDVIAWICEYGTGIDYPVVRGEDNFEYLNKSAKGTYSLAGAIFMDYRNHADFSDTATTLYGHHMSYGVMFGDIDQFSKEGFLESHRYGSLYDGSKTYGLENFAYIETDAYDSEVYREGVSAAQLPSYVETLRKKAMQTMPVEVREGDRIVLLSTCATGYTDARQIVAAKISDQVQGNTFPDQHAKTGILSLDFTHAGEWHQVPIPLLVLLWILLILVIVWTVFRKRKK